MKIDLHASGPVGARDAQWTWGTRVVRTVAVLVLALAGCLFLLPSALGGPASYVVTDGNSMLPRFRADGLVIAREQRTYKVGDVVAYRNGDLHAVVMHRIVDRHGDRYVFKGDNNDFRDSYEPPRDDLVGKEWIYVPRVGHLLRVLRQPALFGGLIAVIAYLSVTTPRRHRGRRHHRGW